MDLKLWCDNCIELQLFEGAQDVFIRLTEVPGEVQSAHGQPRAQN